MALLLARFSAASVWNQPLVLSSTGKASNRQSISSSCSKVPRAGVAMASSIQSQKDKYLEKAPQTGTTGTLKLTYLEGNSWLWDVAGVRILIDPVLVGNLDFGVPWLYNGAKKTLKDMRLEEVGEVDFLLISQSLDDHCHKRTLEPLSKMQPDIRVIATPNAQPKLSKLFSKVEYIAPGEWTSFPAKNGLVLKFTAVAGPVLGPPWQRPENGHFVEVEQKNITLYTEPHCLSDREMVKNMNKKVDVLVTPIVKQIIKPFFTLVSGEEDALELAKVLQPRYFVPMFNGDLDDSGLLSKMLTQSGSKESFKEELAKVLPDARLLDPIPGVPLSIDL